MALSLSYYRQSDIDSCNVAETDRELMVNCVGQVVFQRPFTSDRPEGRKDYYLLYCTSGAMMLRLEGEERRMGAGDLAILPPNTPYYYEFDGTGELIYLWTHFTGSAAEDFIQRVGLTVNRLLSVGSDEALAVAFRNLTASFTQMDEWQQTEAAGRLLVLLSMLGRAVKGKHVHSATVPVRRSMAYMEAHYTSPLTLTELAAIECLSVSRYSALFRSCTGISPKDYLIRLRLSGAMELLNRTEMSISQVAQAVGYADPLYFSRLFKTRIGVPPSAMRGR